MELLPWVFSSGWASGINGYAVVVVLGVLGRLGADDVPSALQRTDVLVAALLMWCIDAVADKIPYLDSTWDTIHTAIRPTIGAIVAALIAGDQGTLGQATAAVDRRRDGAGQPPGQGRHPARGQHVAGAGEQHRGEHRRGPRRWPASSRSR